MSGVETNSIHKIMKQRFPGSRHTPVGKGPFACGLCHTGRQQGDRMRTKASIGAQVALQLSQVINRFSQEEGWGRVGRSWQGAEPRPERDRGRFRDPSERLDPQTTYFPLHNGTSTRCTRTNPEETYHGMLNRHGVGPLGKGLSGTPSLVTSHCRWSVTESPTTLGTSLSGRE